VPPEWFNRWWSPPEFFATVKKHNDAIPELDFFANPKLQPLRGAYAAGFFSYILAQARSVLVKLDADRFPDFDLRFDKNIVGFELVEADQEGRRRTDEYREAERRKSAGLPEEMEFFDPVEELEAAVPAIQRAVEKKAAKNYKPAPHLLVYVNFWLFDKPPLTPAEFEARLQQWRQAFPEVWLLWGANAIRCWPDPTCLVGVPPGARP
jgi:hypothetical protein